MHTPDADYIQFWLTVFGGGLLMLCIMGGGWVWLFCALCALGSPRYWTWRRMFFALLLGPMAVGDIVNSHRKW